MSSTTQSYLIHFIGGAIIAVIPILIIGLPTNWQDVTVGGILGMTLKLGHDLAGY